MHGHFPGNRSDLGYTPGDCVVSWGINKPNTWLCQAMYWIELIDTTISARFKFEIGQSARF